MRFHLPSLLRNADAGSDAGGGAPAAVEFNQAQQEKLNSLIAAEKRKFQQALAERDTKLSEFEKRFGEFEAEKQKAAEEAELKGKSELEKLQHQLKKASDQYKGLETEAGRKYGELESRLKSRDAEFVGYVKKTLVSEAVLPGAAEGMGSYALEAFLREADIELGEGNTLSAVNYDGKRYEKAADAAKAFFARAPGFAKPPIGGSGSSRAPVGGAGAGLSLEGSGEQLFARGLAARSTR